MCEEDSDPFRELTATTLNLVTVAVAPRAQPASPERGDGSAWGVGAVCLTSSGAGKQNSRLLLGEPS